MTAHNATGALTVARPEPATLDGEWVPAEELTDAEARAQARAQAHAERAERIREAHQRITVWEAQQQDLADRIRGETEMLREYGIHPAAFRSARKFLKGSEADRANIDASYLACRSALGLPVQESLQFS